MVLSGMLDSQEAVFFRDNLYLQVVYLENTHRKPLADDKLAARLKETLGL